MRLVTFRRNGVQAIGSLISDDAVSDLSADGAPYFSDMLALIDGGQDAFDHAQALSERPKSTVQLDDVNLCAALPEPRQMRDFLCFEKHLRQARRNRYLVLGGDGPKDVPIPDQWYKYPLYYKCNRLNVIGTDDDVTMPSYTKFLDFELEFAAVTGKSGRNVRHEEAMAHIFGFCVFNDFSARDAQMLEMQGGLGPAKGKDFDTGNAIGPWLVTADEVGDPYSLEMIARINGEEICRGTSADMHHRFEDILAYVSQDETIYPGEFFGSGTVGNGCGLEIGRFLNVGDVVELEISSLGVLRNRIVASDP